MIDEPDESLDLATVAFSVVTACFFGCWLGKFAGRELLDREEKKEIER